MYWISSGCFFLLDWPNYDRQKRKRMAMKSVRNERKQIYTRKSEIWPPLRCDHSFVITEKTRFSKSNKSCNTTVSKFRFGSLSHRRRSKAVNFNYFLKNFSSYKKSTKKWNKFRWQREKYGKWKMKKLNVRLERKKRRLMKWRREELERNDWRGAVWTLHLSKRITRD